MFNNIEDDRPESDEEFANRIHQECRTKSYNARIRELQELGQSYLEAKIHAKQEYPPLAARLDPGMTEYEEKLSEQARQDMKKALKPKSKRVSHELYADKEPATQRQVMTWVFENMHIDGLKPFDAPSAGAWGYLKAILNDKTGKLMNDFYGKWLASATKQVDESTQSYVDDGRKVGMIDRVIRAAEEAKK